MSATTAGWQSAAEGCPVPISQFEQIDFGRARNLDKNLVLRLSDGSWVQEHRNVIAAPPTVGNSFLCSAIGPRRAHGFKTRYFNCTKLSRRPGSGWPMAATSNDRPNRQNRCGDF